MYALSTPETNSQFVRQESSLDQGDSILSVLAADQQIWCYGQYNWYLFPGKCKGRNCI